MNEKEDNKKKPCLIEFLKKKTRYEKGKEVYHMCGKKYYENKSTDMYTRISESFVVIFFCYPYKNLLNKFNINGFIKVPFFIIYGGFIYFVMEIIHWFYIKYEKIE